MDFIQFYAAVKTWAGTKTMACLLRNPDGSRDPEFGVVEPRALLGTVSFCKGGAGRLFFEGRAIQIMHGWFLECFWCWSADCVDQNRPRESCGAVGRFVAH